MSDMLRFMTMVAPASPETWFTIHHRTFIDGKVEPIFPGNAHKTIATAVRDAQYWANKGHCVYISQGIYRNAGPVRGIYPAADRSYPNLVACKNLYIDCDVKPDGYKTVDEMKLAVKGFLQWFKLWPNVIVGSGSGGWHLYWTLNTAIDEREFKNLAGRLINAGTEYGLLFDKQCTRDATRLLRVVATWNFKHATDEVPATPVTLEYCGKDHFDIDKVRRHLERWPVTVTQGVRPELRVVGGTDVHGLPLDENADLTGGLKKDYAPISIEDAAKNCPFIANTLAAGGANLVGDPQWHTVMALACHTTEPRETAHKLCFKSPHYTVEGTDQKLETAQQARANRSTIGPPKCEYISGTLGRDECKSCKYLDLHTSPLSIGFKQPNGHRVNFSPATIPAGAQPIEFHYPYYQDPVTFQIFMTLPDDGSSNRKAKLVFEYPIMSGAIVETGKPFQLVFDTIQGERQVTKRFDTTIVSDNTSFAKAMAAEGLTVNINPPDLPRAFVSSYISKLQEKPETLITVPAFGWALDNNGDMGFSYAGEFVSPAGTMKCAKAQENVENYRVQGSEQVWIDIAKLIITPDRPDLACMVASSFAAPLVGMTGEKGLLMGVTSPASGIGKSTALTVGQTVWSNPGGVGGLNDTVIYTFNKCATLRHLPIFYDEIKGDAQLKAMVQIAFQLTRGQEKGRSDRSGKMRKVNEFKTLCGYAANGSIVAGVRDEDKGTDASWLRMFEMEGITTDPSSVRASTVQQLLNGLELNHGGIGRRYATFLGQNHKSILRTLVGSSAQFAQDLGAAPKVERFWVAAIATTLLGAFLANSLGVVAFPIDEMKKFMFKEFHRMKREMAEDPGDLSKEEALINLIGAFLNEKQARNMIKLDKTWTAQTRPPKGFANIINERPEGQWGKLEVQLSGKPLLLKISDMALTEWCGRTKHQKNLLISNMKNILGATRSTARIGAGSRLAGASENVWVINAAPGTAIETYLEYAIQNNFLP